MSLVEDLRAAGVEADAIPGGKGQFDVLVDGSPVFSKQALGRFPEDGEIAALVAGRP